jgi:hypothetical protein
MTEDYVPSRVLPCTRCRAFVRVYEPQGRWIEEDLYVCGSCLRPIEEQEREPQLELWGITREETPDYRPEIAAIPF